MPLPIAHGLVGVSLVRLIHPNANLKNWQPLLIGFILANCPDLDFIGSYLFGWQDFHRGISHSLFFAFLISAGFFLIFRNQNWRVPLAFSAAFLSHTILDFLFAKSGAVRLLIPFDYNTYKLGLLSFSEITRGFNSEDLIKFSIFEILVFAPLFFLIDFVKTRKFI